VALRYVQVRHGACLLLGQWLTALQAQPQLLARAVVRDGVSRPFPILQVAGATQQNPGPPFRPGGGGKGVGGI